MKKRNQLTLSLACFLLAFLCSMIWQRQREENLAEQISPNILRFHILANSNAKKDQELKLKVKTFLLEELSKTEADSKEDFITYVQDNKENLTASAQSYMESLGYPYKAQIEITECYFPTKAYGDMILPCGTYDAVEVRLGNGRGRNWWCVLYPRLCFVDATHAVVPDTSKALLKELLIPETYEALLDKKDSKIQVRFLLPELAADLLGN